MLVKTDKWASGIQRDYCTMQKPYSIDFWDGGLGIFAVAEQTTLAEQARNKKFVVTSKNNIDVP